MAEIARKNPVNEAGSKPVHTRSKFKPNYSRYDTHIFGLNTPHYVAAGIGGDVKDLHSRCDVDTFNLKAPLMQPIRRSLDYFMVPLRAILPNGAEKIITNPLRGDDVDALTTNCVLSSTFIHQYLRYWINSLPSFSSATAIGLAATRFFRWFQVASWFVSKGSLPKYLGISLDSYTNFYYRDSASRDHRVSLDYIYETFVNHLVATAKANGADTMTVTLVTISTSLSGTSVIAQAPTSDDIVINVDLTGKFKDGEYSNIWTLNRFLRSVMNLERPISTVTFYQGSTNLGESVEITGHFTADDITALDVLTTRPYFSVSFNNSNQQPLNILRVAAYQLACAEFYTIDSVDDVYDSRLYLQNMMGLARIASGSYAKEYVYNGVPVQYDALSGQMLTNVGLVMLNSVSTYISASTYNYLSSAQLAAWAYFHNLFTFTRSLKTLDYFGGSRVAPLAVGDTNVEVQSGSPDYVDILDVTRNIQVQRFLNQVNRVGRKFKDYMIGVLGSKPLADAHEPIFLGHISDQIGAEETENTGAAQMEQAVSVTSKMRNNSQRYAFTVHVSEPCILIGITNYDIPRVYESVTDRENFHIDRYDAFNPFMQFVGDQELFARELCIGASGEFGYSPRYAEYKERVDVCAGGFASGVLPGFAKIQTYDALKPLNNLDPHIGSDFIRSKIGDIDEFYSVLTHTAPGMYFNFIVRVDNEVDADRPMAFNPSIL